MDPDDDTGTRWRIGVASDHAGHDYKTRLLGWLAARGHAVVDFGAAGSEPVDYPRFIRPCVEALGRGDLDRAIVLGGSGNGEAMVANRVRGVRCALCWSVESARLARAHNDANALALGERLLDWELVERIVATWLETGFDGGRHARRVAMIDGGG